MGGAMELIKVGGHHYSKFDLLLPLDRVCNYSCVPNYAACISYPARCFELI